MRRSYRGQGLGAGIPATQGDIVLSVPFSTDLIGDVGLDPVTVSFGGASVSSGKLNCTGGSAGVDCNATNFSAVLQTFAIGFHLTPNWTGNAPDVEQMKAELTLLRAIAEAARGVGMNWKAGAPFGLDALDEALAVYDAWRDRK